LQKIPDYEIAEFAKTQLTLPDKIDPADEMSWQHYLYSKLGNIKEGEGEVTSPVQDSNEKTKMIDEVVERIVAMAKVLFGLHMVRFSIYSHVEIIKNIKFYCHYFHAI
jgi:ryanodine receptor 2